jgi:hypothetical protein
MIGPLKILMYFIIIIGVCTVISGLLWYNTDLSGQTNSRSLMEDIMVKYQQDKQSLGELKQEQSSLKKTVKVTAFNEINIVYTNPDNHTLIIQNITKGKIVKTSYDIDYDGKMDIFEYYDNENITISRQFDVNRDGIIDIIEKDYNNDGVLSTNELKINIEGQFIPFTTINTIIM